MEARHMSMLSVCRRPVEVKAPVWCADRDVKQARDQNTGCRKILRRDIAEGGLSADSLYSKSGAGLVKLGCLGHPAVAGMR